MIDTISKVDCTGCFGCYNVCPKQCIHMEPDIEGFLYPKVDYNECIECGLCREVCPSLNKLDVSKNYEEPIVYAAWSLDEEIRLNSATGGIFSELALMILDKGGYICGAVYNNKHLVEHYITNKPEGLNLIRQSKYIQSEIGSIFKEIKRLLIQGETVLFSGTPCQCAGLNKYLGKKYERLIVVDLVCRGVNSPTVYMMFLKELERIYGAKVSRVGFKDKTYGWNKSCTKVEFENGEAYLQDRFSDLFMKGFTKANLYMRASCSECKYKTFPRGSDITVADFWRIKLQDETQDIDKGTSLVMINSERGEALFDRLKDRLFYETKTLDEAKFGNPCITKPAKANENKQDFLDQLDKMSILENIERFVKKVDVKK